jgi:hypothetical protein
MPAGGAAHMTWPKRSKGHAHSFEGSTTVTTRPFPGGNHRRNGAIVPDARAKLEREQRFSA